MASQMMSIEEGWAEIQREGVEILEEYLETGIARYTPSVSSSASSSSSSSTQQNGDKQSNSSSSDSPNDAKAQVKTSIFPHSRFMTLYAVVYNLCTQRTDINYSNSLYEKHGQVIEKYIKDKVAPKLKDKSGFDLLKAMKFRWENHIIFNTWMEKIFTYLDRYFVRAYAKTGLKKRGLEMFYQHAFVTKDAAVRIELMDLINQERNGQSIDQQLARSLIAMYIQLGVDSLDLYQKHFEIHLLPATQDYYSSKADEWLASGSFSEYLIRVEQALDNEEKRSNSYLHSSTLPKLSAVVQRTLLSDRMQSLLSMDTGILFLLQEERIEDLQRLYRLFGHLDNGHEPIADQFSIYIQSRGSAVVDQHTSACNAEVQAVADQKNVKTVIQKQLLNLSIAQDFLNLQDYFKELSIECFKHELPFQRAMKEAFGDFMNKNIGTHTMAAVLSAFCDQLLRSRCSAASHDSIEQTLTKVVGLFTYLCDKDLFADIYRNQLARRLLTDTSTSTDAEKVMISKLKLTCGSQFTSRLEGMLNDLATAAETQAHYKTVMKAKMPNLPASSLLRDNFSVSVLTSGNWPTYQTPEVNLPPEMQKCIKSFQDWYINEKTSHRKLSWVHHLGQVTITSRFPGGKVYDIQCNTFQACLLLLFGNDKVLSTSVIHEALGLDEVLIKKLIACFNVAKILMKAKTENADEFQVNDNFSSKLRLIKVPIPVQAEEHNKDKVEEDRSIAIEAAVVRIMKSRKTLRHTELVVEVLNQLTLFKPNPRLIKTKIESLIDREFLSRNADDRQMYMYVA